MYTYNYLICAIAQMVFAAFIWRSAYMDERKNKLYIASIALNALTLLGYAARSVVNDGDHFLLNYLINAVIYFSAILLAYFVLLTILKRNGILYKIVTGWMILILLYIVTTPWTHLAFYIDADGYYQRGSMNQLMFISQSMLILLWIVMLAFVYRNVELKKRFYVYLLGILEIAAVILQMFESEFKVIYVAASFFLQIYYVFVIEVEGRYDQMTGVFSKRFYFSEIDRLPNNDSYLVFMMDANGLKHINDNMGHEYGDMVIESVGHSAWTVMHSKAKIFRTGGDEFVGFSSSIQESEMLKYIDEINAKLVEESGKLGFEVATSIGYAIHNPGEDFQTTLHRADESMYKVKTEYYESTGKTRRV